MTFHEAFLNKYLISESWFVSLQMDFMQKQLLIHTKLVLLLIAAWSLFHTGVLHLHLVAEFHPFFRPKNFLLCSSEWKYQQIFSDLKRPKKWQQQQKKLPKEPAQPHLSNCLFLEFSRGFSYPGWDFNLEQHLRITPSIVAVPPKRRCQEIRK